MRHANMFFIEQIQYANGHLRIYTTDTSTVLKYNQSSNISGTKSQNLIVCLLSLQLILGNLLKPGVESRMKI